MFIAPRKHWSPETARVLLPFCEMPLVLASPVRDLDVRVREAVRGIGCGTKSVTAVSIGAIERAVNQLPAASRKNARQGFAAGFQIAQDATLDDLLERSLGGFSRDAERNCLFGMPSEVTAPLIDRLDRDLKEIATTGLRLSVGKTLTLNAGFARIGRGDLAAKVEPFTWLYRAGNLPMGPLRDGTFLVLVA